MEIALSRLQQKTVWEGWMASEVRALYFADLCHRYQWQQRVATWATLIASSGAFVTLLGEWLPPGMGWVRAVFAAVAAGVSLWLLVAQNQRRATDCSDLHARWGRLANQYKALWDAMYDDDARARLADLEEQEVLLGKSSDGFPNETKLLEKWQDHVAMHHAAHPA